MILTVEILDKEYPEVALCFDQEGLTLLLKKLEFLSRNKTHLHLMTPSWSGNELTEQIQGGEKYSLINSLRLVKI